MIHLDKNYLIGLLVRGSAPATNVDKWLAAGESMATSAVAWSEFPANGFQVGVIPLQKEDQ